MLVLILWKEGKVSSVAGVPEAYHDLLRDLPLRSCLRKLHHTLISLLSVLCYQKLRHRDQGTHFLSFISSSCTIRMMRFFTPRSWYHFGKVWLSDGCQTALLWVVGCPQFYTIRWQMLGFTATQIYRVFGCCLFICFVSRSNISQLWTYR